MTRADWIGSIGVFLLLVAFFFNAFGMVEARSRSLPGLEPDWCQLLVLCVLAHRLRAICRTGKRLERCSSAGVPARLEQLRPPRGALC
jgi:hypothetical protein